MSTLLNEKNIYNKYLSLLKASKFNKPTLYFLKSLYKKHIETIAYTNLDFMLNRPVFLNPEATIQKFIKEFKGGVCYELSYSFYNLLTFLGYSTKIVYANLEKIGNMVFRPSETAHTVILVYVNKNTYLLDVAFGNTFRNLINIDNGATEEKIGHYKIVKDNNIDYPYSLQKKQGNSFTKMYSFSTENIFYPPPIINSENCTKEQFPNFYDDFIYLLPNKNGSEHIINNTLIREMNDKKEAIQIENAESLKSILIHKMSANPLFIEKISHSFWKSMLSTSREKSQKY